MNVTIFLQRGQCNPRSGRDRGQNVPQGPPAPRDARLPPVGVGSPQAPVPAFCSKAGSTSSFQTGEKSLTHYNASVDVSYPIYLDDSNQ